MILYPTTIRITNGEETPVVVKIRQFMFFAEQPRGERLELDDYDVEYEDGTPVPVAVQDDVMDDLAASVSRSIEAMVICA